MATMGGLDCIAMAVEHLERSERSDSEGEGPPPPRRERRSEQESPVAAVPVSLAPLAPEPRFFYGAPEAYAHRGHYPPPPQSSFLHQPRVVTADPDACAVVVEAGLGSTAAATGGGGAGERDDLQSSDDARHIEELRRMIFQVDLCEWKSLPGVDEREVITKVTHADVLCGRGGETNHHKGNVTFRACVKACQPAYIEAKRREKPYIAQRIVVFIRKMGGRFLKREGDASAGGGDAWKDVGNNKAREKTSQALREGAPELRGDVAKDVVSTTTSSAAPSVPPGARSFVHDPYYEYGPRPAVPAMVTVTSPYDAVLAAPPVWHAHAHAHGGGGTTTARRPSKKQKRRESSHYAKAAETVLAHCPRPTVVPVVSEGSLAMLSDPRTAAAAAAMMIPAAPRNASELDAPSSSAPGTPRVTVSSDEEERSNASQPSPSRSSQRPVATGSNGSSKTPSSSLADPSAVPSVVVAHSGPRLKLLKKRILSADS